MDKTPRGGMPSGLPEDNSTTKHARKIDSTSRRNFLGKLGAATVAASVIGNVPKALAQTSKDQATVGNGINSTRVQRAYNLRVGTAKQDYALGPAPQSANGDEQLYSDKSGSYSKPLLQDGICQVNLGAWASFKKALQSAKNSDYEAIIIGGTRTLNGPQASYAFDLEALDCVQWGNAPAKGDPLSPPLVPPFDTVTSASYGTQLIEMYWASLLRDVAFTDYGTNATAAAAAARADRAIDLSRSERRKWQRYPGSVVPRKLRGRDSRAVCVAARDHSHQFRPAGDSNAVHHVRAER